MKFKAFRDYIVFSDGSVYNRFNNTVKPIVKDNRYYIRLKCENSNKREMLSLPRILYYLFVEKFDITDQRFCITFKDGNPSNINIDNLALIERKGVNFKLKLDKKDK